MMYYDVFFDSIFKGRFLDIAPHLISFYINKMETAECVEEYNYLRDQILGTSTIRDVTVCFDRCLKLK